MFAVLFAACEETEPPTSDKVVTGASENITKTSATLKGAVNVDIATYNSVEFGIMYGSLLEEVNNRSAQMVKGSVLMGKDFSIQLADLTDNTKYYYCAYLLLNGMQYEFGAVKEFTTLASIKDPDTPDVPAYTAVFIRGQFNEWGESHELTTTDGDYYVLETTFDLQGEFKIASSDWSTINYGGTHTISAGTEQVLIEGSNDNLTADGNIAVAKVEFTVSTGILLITAAQTPSTPEEPSNPSNPSNPSDSEEPSNPNNTPQEFVAKPFSVSFRRTVTFSPGNLQYHPANNEWRFAPSQLDYIGNDNANISDTYNGWIDLFGWGTGDNPTNASTDYEDYQTFVDWGVNQIGSYAPNTWRTLTDAEWEYLIEERPNYDKLIGVAKVNGVNGLILLPDGWTCPSGVTFKSGFHNDYGTEYYADYQTFSSSEWTKLEVSGAVFLPAAGYRYGSYVGRVQNDGDSWSATEYFSNRASSFAFGSDWAYTGACERGSGLPVRLVQD